MTRPVVSGTTERAYVALGPHTTADEVRDWPLLRFVQALVAPLAQVDILARDTDAGPGWSGVFDVDRAPGYALPWLAQLVGVRLPGGLTDAEQRDVIRDRRGWKRGTPSAIRAAARTALVGSRRVELFERDGSAYRLRVRTYQSETPDTVALEAAVRQEKPAGLVLTFEVLSGATYAHMTSAHGPAYSNFTTAFGSYAAARDHTPES